MNQIFQAVLLGGLLSKNGGKRLSGVTAKPSQQDLLTMNELIEAGKVNPVIDCCYSFAEIREALGYLGEGHAVGKVVISMAENQA